MSGAPERPSREERINEIIAEVLESERTGAALEREELLRRYPEFAQELDSFLADREHFRKMAGPTDTATVPPTPATPDEKTIAPKPVEAPTPGTSLRYFGDYELVEEIARGGMGVVYKARQVSLDRIVALKMILAGQLAGEDDVERFLTEAQAAAGLQHPNIVAIHEISQHEGQHYFSMDYVQGRSLADYIRDNPLPAKDAARYVQIVAQAIDYAHKQGTLHRDLKPANILIDRFNRPQVTDFGLAKRVGRQGQTATGAVLGTPSYMPPEQASGKHENIGPASDVYSLGAVLYDLVTGRPPFQAATTIDILLQVINQDPVSPRSLNPSIPRDLETIILKCLARDPLQRYASAQDLADDLQAFLEHKPIKARRPALGDRVVRWAKCHRRSITAVALTTAAAILLIAAGIGAWHIYLDRSMGSIQFSSNGPPLFAEVYKAKGAIRPDAVFTIPTQEHIPLFDSQYLLHVSANYRLSEKFHMMVKARQDPTIQVDLKDRLLWEQLKAPKIFDLVNFAGPPIPGQSYAARNDFVVVSPRGMQRIDGRTGEVLWVSGLSAEKQPALARWGKIENGILEPSSFSASYIGDTPVSETSPRVVRPAPDVNGDGVPDIIWASHISPSLLAVSGADGAVLWWHPALVPVPFPPEVEPNLLPNLDNDKTQFHTVRLGLGAVFGMPILLRDRQKQGEEAKPAPLLIATVYAGGGKVGIKNPLKNQPGNIHLSPGQWIEAVAVDTGKMVWRFQLPEKQVTRYGAELHSINNKQSVVFIAGEYLHGLDAATGKPLWTPRHLKAEPLLPPRFIDLNADGELDVLVAAQQQGRAMILHAFTLATGRSLWSKRLEKSINPVSYLRRDIQPEWPLLIGPGGDASPIEKNKKVMIIVPSDAKKNGGKDLHGIVALEGATGKTIWKSKPLPEPIEPECSRRFAIGPDLDADGCREIFRALVVRVQGGYSEAEVNILHVDALSGRDGNIVWTKQHQLTRNRDYLNDNYRVEPLQWLPVGPDGGPVLLVPLLPGNNRAGRLTLLISARNGRLAYEIGGLHDWLPPTDLDGDGLPDLIGKRPAEVQKPYDWYRLHAIRMYAPETWRRLGKWLPTQDYDNDGIADLVNITNGNVMAVSGKDGRLLWQSSIYGTTRGDRSYTHLHEYTIYYRPSSLTFPMPEGDLDGDNLPDVVVYGARSPSAKSTLTALSGKDGGEIWRATELAQANAGGATHYYWIQCKDLDGDGKGEIVFYYRGREATQQNFPQVVAVLSGQTGKLLWQYSLGKHQTQDLQPVPVFGDLNGDETLDIVVSLRKDTFRDWEVHALNGANGAPFWKRDVHSDDIKIEMLPFAGGLETTQSAFARTGDIDGDGRAEVALCVSPTRLEPASSIVVLDGATGKPMPSWPMPSWNEAPKDRVEYTSAPLLLKRKKGSLIAVNRSTKYVDRTKGIHYYYKNEVFIYDSGRREVLRREVKRPSFPRSPWERGAPWQALFLWNQDVNGDGNEELLYFEKGRLHALAPTSNQLIWQSPTLGEESEIHGFVPADKMNPLTIVVVSEETTYGIEAATGKIRWRSDGPGDIAGWLTNERGNRLPRLIFAVNNQFTACRLPLPTDPSGNYRLSLDCLDECVASYETTEYRLLPWVLHSYQEGFAWWSLAQLLVIFGALICLILLRNRELVIAFVACYLCLVALFCSVYWWTDNKLPSQQYVLEGWYLCFLFPEDVPALYIFVCLTILWVLLRKWLRLPAIAAIVLSVLLAPVGPAVLAMLFAGWLLRLLWTRIGRRVEAPVTSKS